MMLKLVEPRDAQFLWDLMKERLAEPANNISHRRLPTWEQHCRFVDFPPYDRWCIIYDGDHQVGACYITKRSEIGIYLRPQFRGHGLGRRAVRALMICCPRPFYLANVNPENTASRRFWEAMKGELRQVTYEVKGEA